MRFCHLLLILPLLGACSRDHRTDLQKLSDFHKQLATVDHRLAAASTAYTDVSKAALGDNNRAALYSAASTLRLAMVGLLPAAKALDVPDFKSKDAASDTAQARAALVSQITDLQAASAALKAVYDPQQPTPAALAAAAQAQNQANTDAVAESSEIIQAYDDLGIAPDRVDTAHGGLKKK